MDEIPFPGWTLADIFTQSEARGVPYMETADIMREQLKKKYPEMSDYVEQDCYESSLEGISWEDKCVRLLDLEKKCLEFDYQLKTVFV